MTKSETKLIKAAVQWWYGKRPMSFSPRKHLLHPHINCVTNREHKLAESVAAYLSEKRRKA